MKLLLLGTAGCHLCEQAQSLIQTVLKNYPHLTVEQIDIAEHAQWQEKYAVKIPVLFHPQTRRELGWFFDAQALNTFINALLVLDND